MARIIQFEGRQISVPDDATDEEIQGIVDGGSSPTAAAPTAAPAPRLNETGLPTAVPQRSTPGSTVKPNPPGYDPTAGMDPITKGLHGLQANMQAVNSGLADIAGAPLDIPIAGANLAGWLYNQAAGPLGLPQSPGINYSASGTIKQGASDLASLFGAPPLTADQMSPNEQFWQHPIELGTTAFGGGAGLTARVPTVINKIASQTPLSWLDRQAVPFLNSPGYALGKNTAVGVGSGLGLDQAHSAAQNVFPNNQPAQKTADVVGMILGGMLSGGAYGGLSDVGQFAKPTAANPLWQRFATDTKIPATDAGKSYTPAQTNLAARVAQGDTLNPTTAAANISDNSAALTAAGVPKGSQPTAGLLSNDPGMVGLEQGFRARDPAQFIERDLALKGEAADRVASLTNPNADQSAVGPGIQNEVTALKTDRDMAALPLLRQAEASGVPADPTPVVNLIDNQLAIVKRPSVRAALTEARKALYVVGQPDTLDTSVTGLYEARKAINDVIAGRGENSTGQFAVKELSAVRDSLDAAITKVSPEFGQYLTNYREGSAPLDEITNSATAQKLIEGGKTGDPRNVAASLFSGYGGENEAKSVAALVANDPKAAAGWKAAVAEVLTDKVTNTTQIGDSYSASFARLATEFKKNEGILTSVFSPEEMNNLRQAHALLGYFKSGEQRATTGSQTAENLLRVSPGDAFARSQTGMGAELILKHVYGVLKGGGMMRRYKLMVNLLPNDQSAATEILHQAFFNPSVAAYLLGKKVPDLSAIPAAHGLQAAIRADVASQPSDNQDNQQ